MNEDQGPPKNLITCPACNQAMRLEKVDPDNGGSVLVHYRCKLCGEIERVRLLPPHD